MRNSFASVLTSNDLNRTIEAMNQMVAVLEPDEKSNLTEPSNFIATIADTEVNPPVGDTEVNPPVGDTPIDSVQREENQREIVLQYLRRKIESVESNSMSEDELACFFMMWIRESHGPIEFENEASMTNFMMLCWHVWKTYTQMV